MGNDFRKGFMELKIDTQKDISEVKAEVSRGARTIHSAVVAFEQANLGSIISQADLEEEQSRREKAESLLREKIQENIEIRAANEAYQDQINSKMKDGGPEDSNGTKDQ